MDTKHLPSPNQASSLSIEECVSMLGISLDEYFLGLYLAETHEQTLAWQEMIQHNYVIFLSRHVK